MPAPSRAVNVSSVLTTLLLVLPLLLDFLGSAQGQNYHYSNGWYPGKRGGHSPRVDELPISEDQQQPRFTEEDPILASAAALFSSVPTPAGELQCRQRHRVLRQISQLITDEIARLERSCSSDETVNFLKTLVELSSRHHPEAPVQEWTQLKKLETEGDDKDEMEDAGNERQTRW